MSSILNEDIEERTLNAYENIFPESSEIIENTSDFNLLYHKNKKKKKKSIFPNHSKFTKICNWKDRSLLHNGRCAFL